MYDMNTTLGELFEIPAVKAFLNEAAPGMVDGPNASYMTPLSVNALLGVAPDSAPLAKAMLNVANGKDADYHPIDPKTVKPKLTSFLSTVYDVDDADGKMYMLDHHFSGCFIVCFSKTIDETIPGRITYDGKELPWSLRSIAMAGNKQLLGIFVRDICTEYDTTYTVHVEGFTDTDGNTMEPEDYEIRTVPDSAPDPAYAEHDRVALQAAEEGIVLLKNKNQALPLTADARIRLVGAGNFRVGAVGAGKINPRYTVGLSKAVKASTLTVSDTADTGIIVISRASGENFDNGAFPGQYYLTEKETAELKALRAECGKAIAIINSGYPMDVRFIEDLGYDAAIWCGFPGMLGGEALVNILTGKTNPSGKLTDTWSLDYYDIPSSHNFYMPASPDEALDADHDVWVDTVYEEDIYVGYRYFETFGKDVAYPFGYGLSYTDFAVDAKADGLAAALTRDGNQAFTVTASVKNTGAAAGKEVVQIYAAIPDGKLEQPAKRLIAFKKTGLLQPGETETVTMTVPAERLSSFDEETSSYVIEAGTYTLFAGDSVKTENVISTFAVSETITLRTVERYMEAPVEFTRLSKNDPDSFPQGKLSGITGLHELSHRSSRKHIPDREVIEGTPVDDWSIEELAKFGVCASAGWGMQDVGVAGRINQLNDRGLPYYAVADGNNGVNINKKNIGMPTSNLVCSTWNEDLAYEVGRVIAEEAKENGVQMILAPAMNLHRNPLCGRHPEYFSEDPLLAGRMAGQQSKGLEDTGVDCSVKHVCCNNSESTRKRNHSIVSVRALRELYLRSFAIAFEVNKPNSIMTAYNACNGSFTAADEELLQGIFRGEMGFEGFVMTDWNSYDTADVAEAVQAGNCWLTPGSTDTTYTAPIVEGVKSGKIDESRLRQNAKYMYRVVTAH